MCQYSTEIYFNIALVPAYRDALYLVEERNKGKPTATPDRWEKERERERGRVGENAIWEEFASSRIAARVGDVRGSGRWG